VKAGGASGPCSLAVSFATAEPEPRKGAIINPTERPTPWSSAHGRRDKPAGSDTTGAPCLSNEPGWKGCEYSLRPRGPPARPCRLADKRGAVGPWGSMSPVIQSDSGSKFCMRATIAWIRADAHASLAHHQTETRHLANSLQDAANRLSNEAQRRQRRPKLPCPSLPLPGPERAEYPLSSHGLFGLPHRVPSHSRGFGVVTLLISGMTRSKTSSSIQRHMTRFLPPRAASLGEKAVREPSQPIPARPPRPPLVRPPHTRLALLPRGRQN
jgi:hypothetical protein